jgi:phospholipid/cholesterol/gamma-HCH transport system ATP-binding protein
VARPSHPAAGGPALLQAEDLWLSAGGRPVLREVGFEVAPGEVFVIVGPSGSGKSTLLRHLAGLDRPVRGCVRVQGEDLHAGTEAAQQRLRRRQGVMFQSGALWSSMTVGENLMLPMRLFSPLAEPAMRARALSLLERVGLADAFALAPAQLSGGMRKRAALARALALDPPLLLLDEPGSGLDPLNAQRLDELVLELRHHLGKAVVMVTHEVRSVRAVADRVLYLDDKEMTMTAIGTPEELAGHASPAVRRFFAGDEERRR